VADIVPLHGENRVIVALGLKHIAKHRRVGIAKLAEAAGVNIAEITSEKIGFQLGPRINAAGRLDDGGIALQLLLSECPEESTQIAQMLNEANEERRGIERAIFDEAAEELDAFFDPAQRLRATTVLWCSSRWTRTAWAARARARARGLTWWAR
jgi:single-stranded-DNA-specific exonuclease